MTDITFNQLGDMIKSLNETSDTTNYGIYFKNAVVDYENKEFRCELRDSKTKEICGIYKIQLNQLTDIDTLKVNMCMFLFETADNCEMEVRE